MSDVADWRDLSLDAKRLFLRGIRERAHGGWRERARPEQLPPDDFTTIYYSGGRGGGKSWASSHLFRELIETDPIREAEGPGTWAVVAPTFGDARSKCIESEESGLLLAFDTNRAEVDAGTSPTVRTWNRSIGELYLHDGTQIVIDGADDGAYRIQGLNLRGALCDEIGLWKRWETAWDESLGFALRKGEAKRIATGTPKRNLPARALVKRLLEDPTVATRRLRTEDNLSNLSDSFKREVFGRFAGTELGRQELEGLLISTPEGALFRPEWIDESRVDAAPAMRKVIVALDPSDGTAHGDEMGLAVVGIGQDRALYVLDARATRESPLKWLKGAIRTAREYDASLLIEKNFSGAGTLGDLLEEAMAALGIRVPYQMVTAHRSKAQRAEPVAMLYEQRKVRHVRVLVGLEEQMLSFTGAPGEPSPGMLDAAIHGLRHLMGYGRAARSSDASRAVPYTDELVPNGAVPYHDGVFGEGAVPWRRAPGESVPWR